MSLDALNKLKRSLKQKKVVFSLTNDELNPENLFQNELGKLNLTKAKFCLAYSFHVIGPFRKQKTRHYLK